MGWGTVNGLYCCAATRGRFIPASWLNKLVISVPAGADEVQMMPVWVFHPEVCVCMMWLILKHTYTIQWSEILINNENLTRIFLLLYLFTAQMQNRPVLRERFRLQTFQNPAKFFALNLFGSSKTVWNFLNININKDLRNPRCNGVSSYSSSLYWDGFPDFMFVWDEVRNWFCSSDL